MGSAAREGAQIAAALGSQGKGVVLANHGLLTVGATVDEAGYLFGLLDRCCAVELDVWAATAGKGGQGIGEAEAEFNFRMESNPVSFRRLTVPFAAFLLELSVVGELVVLLCLRESWEWTPQFSSRRP